jgi:hypothetical protein
MLSADLPATVNDIIQLDSTIFDGLLIILQQPVAVVESMPSYDTMLLMGICTFNLNRHCRLGMPELETLADPKMASFASLANATLVIGGVPSGDEHMMFAYLAGLLNASCRYSISLASHINRTACINMLISKLTAVLDNKCAGSRDIYPYIDAALHETIRGLARSLPVRQRVRVLMNNLHVLIALPPTLGTVLEWLPLSDKGDIEDDEVMCYLSTILSASDRIWDREQLIGDAESHYKTADGYQHVKALLGIYGISLDPVAVFRHHGAGEARLHRYNLPSLYSNVWMGVSRRHSVASLLLMRRTMQANNGGVFANPTRLLVNYELVSVAKSAPPQSNASERRSTTTVTVHIDAPRGALSYKMRWSSPITETGTRRLSATDLFVRVMHVLIERLSANHAIDPELHIVVSREYFQNLSDVELCALVGFMKEYFVIDTAQIEQILPKYIIKELHTEYRNRIFVDSFGSSDIEEGNESGTISPSKINIAADWDWTRAKLLLLTAGICKAELSLTQGARTFWSRIQTTFCDRAKHIFLLTGVRHMSLRTSMANDRKSWQSEYRVVMAGHSMYGIPISDILPAQHTTIQNPAFHMCNWEAGFAQELFTVTFGDLLIHPEHRRRTIEVLGLYMELFTDRLLAEVDLHRTILESMVRVFVHMACSQKPLNFGDSHKFIAFRHGDNAAVHMPLFGKGDENRERMESIFSPADRVESLDPEERDVVDGLDVELDSVITAPVGNQHRLGLSPIAELAATGELLDNYSAPELIAAVDLLHKYDCVEAVDMILPNLLAVQLEMISKLSNIGWEVQRSWEATVRDALQVSDCLYQPDAKYRHLPQAIFTLLQTVDSWRQRNDRLVMQ